MDLITIMEADGTIRYDSPSSRSVLGYEPEELVGKNALHYIHPDDLPKVAAALSLETATSDIVTMELRFRHKDGSWVTLEAIGRDLRNNLVPTCNNNR
jgi:PAS domain S-box-containing protein